MITETSQTTMTAIERSHSERIEQARRLWREGRTSDALILIDLLKGEFLTDRVKVECYVAEAAFLAEQGEFAKSLESLAVVVPIVDSALPRVRGAFHFQRARARKELRDFDSALTDYTGAALIWEKIGDHERLGAAALNMAGVYLVLGDLEAAQTNIDRALTLLRKSFYLPQAHDTQARIYLAAGMTAKAAVSIARALDTVGDNEHWRKQFLETLDQVEIRLLEALGVRGLHDLDRVKTNMVRRALQQSSGSTAKAATQLGVTRHAIFSLVKTHAEQLERYRTPKQVRHKSLIKSF